MIGLDTNILVRFFAKDDPSQGKQVRAFFVSLTPAESGFVSLVSLIELVWVLRSRYRMEKDDLVRCLENLLGAPELFIESRRAVTLALLNFAKKKSDFADCLIGCCGEMAGCSETVTLDVQAARSAGMRLLL